MKKRDIPLDLLRQVEVFVKNHSSLIQYHQDANCYYHFTDTSSDSNFFFKIYSKLKDENENKLSNYYRFEFSPRSSSDVSKSITSGYASDVINELSMWGQNIRDYQSIESIVDNDPILKAFSDEFFQSYKVLDEDADHAPFDQHKLLALDSYLNLIEENIGTHKNGVETDVEIDEIKADVIQLRKDLTKSSKTKVMKQLSKIWGKMQKHGLPLIKEFLLEIKKEGFKFLIKRGGDLIELAGDLLKQ